MSSIIVKGILANSSDTFLTGLQRVSQALVEDNTEFTNVFCINRERNIYRVDVSNKERRLALLNNARNLKDHNEFSNVYINKDLTLTQRRENAKRRILSRGLNNRANRNLANANTAPNSAGDHAPNPNITPSPALGIDGAVGGNFH